MILPVPFAARLALSAILMALAVCLGVAANWITPEVMADEPAAKREGRS